MKIFIDIGHPAHVHYFRNFIKIMEQKGHTFFISARDKEVSFALLEQYEIPYYNRGKGSNGMLAKLFYLLKTDYLLYKKAKAFNPDLFISFASPYAAQVSKLLRKPHIAFTDTEHAKLGILSFAPFSDTILTPDSFNKNFGKKQIRFSGFMELCYLHPRYFKPDIKILETVGIRENEKYVLIRFVSWSATHDIGHKGMSYDFKLKLINELRKHCKVFISSEHKLEGELQQYQLNIDPVNLHSILYFSSLYIGEGGTTANECACMGVSNILINSLLSERTIPGIHVELNKYGLQLLFEKASDDIIAAAIRIINDAAAKAKILENRSKMLDAKADVTAFMVWFVENYPESVTTMKGNPDYQRSFR